jgi:hypothetical protein
MRINQILAGRSQLMIGTAEQFIKSKVVMSFCLQPIENVLVSLIKGGMGCSHDQLLTRIKGY